MSFPFLLCFWDRIFLCFFFLLPFSHIHVALLTLYRIRNQVYLSTRNRSTLNTIRWIPAKTPRSCHQPPKTPLPQSRCDSPAARSWHSSVLWWSHGNRSQEHGKQSPRDFTGGKGAWKPVITCWVHLELMCIFPTMWPVGKGREHFKCSLNIQWKCFHWLHFEGSFGMCLT